MSSLAGKRILLVEDEFIIAAMAEDMLTGLGATVIGPASTIATALRLAESDRIDAAVLDVNMDGDRIDPVAEALGARSIPVIFARGTAPAPWAAHRTRWSSTSPIRRKSLLPPSPKR
jgi:CheY-like chemotaxis protein